jgi:hypothetical protein
LARVSAPTGSAKECTRTFEPARALAAEAVSKAKGRRLKAECLPLLLALPLDFLDEFKQAAQEAGLSTAATIRQSAKLGLPKFREQISNSRVTNVAPLPDKVARKLYAEREEDMDSIRRFIAAQPKDAQ